MLGYAGPARSPWWRHSEHFYARKWCRTSVPSPVEAGHCRSVYQRPESRLRLLRSIPGLPVLGRAIGRAPSCYDRHQGAPVHEQSSAVSLDHHLGYNVRRAPWRGCAASTRVVVSPRTRRPVERSPEDRTSAHRVSADLLETAPELALAQTQRYTAGRRRRTRSTASARSVPRNLAWYVASERQRGPARPPGLAEP